MRFLAALVIFAVAIAAGPAFAHSSSAYQDPTSGGGDVEQQESGISFTDGPLAEKGGVEVGQINLGSGAVSMDLNGANGVVLSCLAM
jgi:hypothetical protein